MNIAEPDYTVQLGTEEQTIVEHMSKKLVSYKRVQEIALLKRLIEMQGRAMAYLNAFMERQYGRSSSAVIEESVYRNLTNGFPRYGIRTSYFRRRTVSGKL